MDNKNYYLHEDENLVKSLLETIKLKYDTSKISKLLGVSQRMVYYYFHGEKAISIKSLLKLLSLQEKSNLNNIFYKKFKRISTYGHSGDNLPRYYSNKLAYLTGLICGDGHISKRTEVYIWNESAQYLRNFIGPMFEELFNYKPTFVDMKTYLRLSVSSRPIRFFFTHVLGLPKGKKKNILKIPQFVYLTKSFKINFLRGLFDSDGGTTISKNKKCSVLISSATYNFLQEVQTILKDVGVNLPGPYTSGSRQGYEIRSFSKKEIIKFIKIISSDHPFKRKRLASVAQLVE